MAQPQEMLFVLEISDAGRLFSVRPDGSDKRVIVAGCRLPDGVVVDVEAGHVYWTNMGNPSTDDGSIEGADLDGSGCSIWHKGTRVTLSRSCSSEPTLVCVAHNLMTSTFESSSTKSSKVMT